MRLRERKQQKGAWLGSDRRKVRRRLSALGRAAQQHPRQQLCRLKNRFTGGCVLFQFCLLGHLGAWHGASGCAHPGWAQLSLPWTSLVSRLLHAEQVDLQHLFHCPGSHSAFSPSTDYAKTEEPTQGHVTMTSSISPQTSISSPSNDQGPAKPASPEGKTVVVSCE